MMWNHGRRLRALAAMVATGAAAGVLASCTASTSATGTVFERYYDPAGMFSAEFPVSNDVQPISPDPPGSTNGGATVIGGALSGPPQPTQDTAGLGIGSFASAGGNVYAVFVVDPGSITTPNELNAAMLSDDPTADVRVRRSADVGGQTGPLVVADVTSSTGKRELAAASTLQGGRGYVVLSVFGLGQWSQHRDEFLKVAQSLRTDVPAGVVTLPSPGP